MKALEHGAIHANRQLQIIWIESSSLVKPSSGALEEYTES